MSSDWGNRLHISIFGESHGNAIGVVMDGLPAGEAVNTDLLQTFMARRMGGKAFTTPRKETDAPVFLSGLLNGKTTGAPLCAVIENQNVRSSDYPEQLDMPRPSHADYPAFLKYHGYNDIRGGGHFSGRLTAPLCIAGGICKQILERKGVTVGAHVASVASVSDIPFDPVAVTAETLLAAGKKAFPVLDAAKGEQMMDVIADAARNHDSVGGIVECGVLGMPAGVGEPLFGGVENRISSVVFGIGAVRGIEFGDGFAAATMRGSVHNDPYCYENGQIRTETNRHGGVLGGLTSGMPILFRVAFKPTPTISQPQKTVSLVRGEADTLTMGGRHDPCIVPRAVPCVEAATAIALTDLILNV